MYMLTSARETGSCQVSSFGTTQIILANVLSVIPVQTCVLGVHKNRLIRRVRRFFWVPKTRFVVKKPSYMSFTHSYLEVWLLFSRTFSKKILQWRQRTVKAHCLKFWNPFCKPILMLKHAMLSFGVLVEDLLGRFMYISQMGLLILPTYMNSYLVGLEIFLSLPSLHTHQRRRASKILDALLQGQE